MPTAHKVALAVPPPCQLSQSPLIFSLPTVAACVDKASGRFKLILFAEPVPSKILNGYNGKPVLLTASTTTHTGFIDATDNGGQYRYLELDANIRQWNMFVRKSLFSLWDAVGGFGLELGCCIEGRSDEEMPEQLLGCTKLSQLQWSSAAEIDVAPSTAPF